MRLQKTSVRGHGAAYLDRGQNVPYQRDGCTLSEKFSTVTGKFRTLPEVARAQIITG